MCFRPPEVTMGKMCPECGLENPMEAETCEECGCKLPVIMQSIGSEINAVTRNAAPTTAPGSSAPIGQSVTAPAPAPAAPAPPVPAVPAPAPAAPAPAPAAPAPVAKTPAPTAPAPVPNSADFGSYSEKR